MTANGDFETVKVFSGGELTVVVERSGRGAETLVLLHAGVTDRRGWRSVARSLQDVAQVISYDRRGFGDSPKSDRVFTHLDDLQRVLDEFELGRAWLVGSSMGGALALDAALAAPERVAGLVLIAPAVSGSPSPDALDEHTARLDEAIDAALAAGDPDLVNRLETWLWLDGPAGPEGRVGGAARGLALAMNAVILANEVDGDQGAGGIDAWSRLHEVVAPTTVIWGKLDVPFIVERSRALQERLPAASSQRSRTARTSLTWSARTPWHSSSTRHCWLADRRLSRLAPPGAWRATGA